MASSTAEGDGLNLDVVTAELREAVERGERDTLPVIVLMEREFTEDDVAFFEDEGIEVYRRLQILPVALLEATPESVVALSWHNGVKTLDLDRPLEFFSNTAVQSTNAAAVWGTADDLDVSTAAPLTDAAGDVIDGRGFSIAVVDSGIDATHPDLPYGEKVLQNKKHVCAVTILIDTRNQHCFADTMYGTLLHGDYNESLFLDMENTDTSSGHGTHVAGIAAGTGAASAGKYTGSAPGAKLVGFSVGEGDAIFRVLESWDYAAYKADDPAFIGENPIRVITNSFGEMGGWTGTQDDVEYAVIKKIVEEKGIVFTFAAGNSGGDGSSDATSSYCDYSGMIPGVLCIANGDDADEARRTTMQLASSSSRGHSGNPDTWPDLTAPGTRIAAAWALTGPLNPLGAGTDYTPYYTLKTGTSMSTPHVAGLVALLFQANPHLTPGDVEDILEDTALAFTAGEPYAADPANPDSETSFDKGHGLVDALAAVQRALETTSAGTTLAGHNGDLLVFQPEDGFQRTVQHTVAVRGNEADFVLYRAGSADWATEPATVDTAAEFRLVDAAGNVVDVMPATGYLSGSELRFRHDAYPWNVSTGHYVLEARVADILVDYRPVQVTDPVDDAMTLIPECQGAPQKTSLRFTPHGVMLHGFIDAKVRVDKVRADVHVDGNPVAWGLESRQTPEGLESFEIKLPLDSIVPGARIRTTVAAGTLPCPVNLDELGTFLPTTSQGAFGLNPANPWINPGFEAAGNPSPTFLRVTGGADRAPASALDVVPSSRGDHAVAVRYDADDHGRDLLAAQILGAHSSPYRWLGANGVTLDYRTADLQNADVVIEYLAADGTEATATVPVTLQADDLWHTLEVPVSVPADASLLVAGLQLQGTSDGDLLLDNVAVTGSTLELVSVGPNVEDGYAVELQPNGPTAMVGSAPAASLKLVQTGLGEAYLASLRVDNLTGASPAYLDLSTATARFGILSADAALSGGAVDAGSLVGIAARNAQDPTIVLFAIDKATAQAQSPGTAVLWADASVDGVSPSGYYNALQASLRATRSDLRDGLDQAMTPVALEPVATADVGQNLTVLVQVPTGGGYTVTVNPPPTGWVESTTLKVTGQPAQTVTLDGSGTELIFHYDGDATDVAAEIEPTLFTRGDAFTPGGPVPDIRICADAPGCATETLEVLSHEDLIFDGTASVDPLGQGLTYQWWFSDNTGDSGQVVTHSFGTPGNHTVRLTVTDAEGNSNDVQRSITVLNRAPSVKVSHPSEASRLDTVTVSAKGVDMDGTVQKVVLTVDGTTYNASGSEVSHTFLPGDLAIGTHTVEAYAIDNEGAQSDVVTSTFKIVNLAPTGALTADRTLIPVDGTVAFAVNADDPEGDSLTLTLDYGDGSTPVTVSAGDALSHTYTAPGTFDATLTVSDGYVSVTTKVTIDVDGTPPTTSDDYQPISGWHRQSVTILLDVEDNHAGARILYDIDGGGAFDYSGSVVVTGDGYHNATHWGVDAVGNVGAQTTVSLRIDGTAPDTESDGMPQDGSIVAGTLTMSVSAEDGLSGMANVRILIDDQVKAEGTATASYDWDTAEASLGYHTVTVEARDQAGNLYIEESEVLVAGGPLGDLVSLLPFGASTPGFFL